MKNQRHLSTKIKILKKLMVDTDVTQLEVLTHLGINQSTYSMYMNGWREFPVDVYRDALTYLADRRHTGS